MPRPGLSQGRCGFTFPLIVHLVLAYPAGRARSAPARALIAAAYIETLLAAAVLALFRDPYFDPGCLANCNVNIFLARSLPSLARADEIADRWFPAAAAAGLIAICAARLVAESPAARRRLMPVAVPAIMLAGTVPAWAVALEGTTAEDPFNANGEAVIDPTIVARLYMLCSPGPPSPVGGGSDDCGRRGEP